MYLIFKLLKYLLFLFYNFRFGTLFSKKDLVSFSRANIHPMTRAVVNGFLKIGDSVTIGAREITLENNCSSLIIEDGVFIGRGSELCVKDTVFIGARTSFNANTRLFGDVYIGDFCIFGHGAYLSSFAHVFKSTKPYLPIRLQNLYEPSISRRVTVGNDCFIGANVFVAPGITIGKGAVIAANACVMKDVLPYKIVAGVPAKVVGDRLKFEPPSRIEALKAEHAPYFYLGFDEVTLSSKERNHKNASVKAERFQLALRGVSGNRLLLRGSSSRKCIIYHGSESFVLGPGCWQSVFEAHFESEFLLSFGFSASGSRGDESFNCKQVKLYIHSAEIFIESDT